MTTGWSLPDAAREAARCRDMSLGGCFLEVATAPPFGTAIIVYVELPDLVDAEGRQLVTAVGSTVRWTTTEGMGVQFGPMGARETAALLRLLGPHHAKA